MFAEGTPEAWQRCYEHFLQGIFRRSSSGKTLAIYRYHLTFFFSRSAGCGPPKQPQNYTREDVADYINLPRQKKSGGAPGVSLMNQRIQTIHGFYTFAATWTMTGPDGKPQPLLQAPAPTLGFKHGKPNRALRALTYEEMEHFFAAIPTSTEKGLRDRAIFLFYFWTARRREEIARLRWGNLEEGVIVDEHGNRRRGHMYHFRGKGKSTIDDVAELPGPAYEALERYLMASGRMATMTADSPLFVSTKGKEEWRHMPLSSSTIFKTLKRYARRAGLDWKRVCIHSWRHTAARARYQAGEDIRSLQHLLRHMSLATTDTYLQMLAGTSDQGAKLLEAQFARFTL